MDGPLITAITGLLIAVGSGIAWLVQRRDKARPRIARQAAEVAQASDAVGGALTVVQDSLTREIARLRADSEADRTRWAAERAADRDRIACLGAADRDRIACLEQTTEKLRRGIETWGAWYRDLSDRWHEHRAQDDPPPPPRP